MTCSDLGNALFKGIFIFIGILTTSMAQAGNPNLEMEVKDLIAQLGVGGAPEEHVYERLEALGMPAVPFIVKYMDNRNELKNKRITLANKSPGAFEMERHYAPQLVVDAVAAILNQMTGKTLGDIYNGSTDKERELTVGRWRAWCIATFPGSAGGCIAE